MKQVLLVLSFITLFSVIGYSQITVTAVATKDPTCLDPTGGEITVTVAGGILPYTVFINSIPPGYAESVVGGPAQTVFVLPAGGHAPLGEGTYLVTATDSDIPFNFASQNVVLAIDLPTPTISGQATVCDGDTETYTTEAGNTNYSWSVVGGSVSGGGGVNDNTISITWNTVGSQSVSVNYVDAGGCTAASPTNYPVTVNSLPSPTIAGPLNTCEATAGNIYTTEAGQSNYVWTVSPGGTITAGGGASDNSVTVTWSGSGAQSVSVDYQNAAGCDALAPTVVGVTVDALPSPTIGGPNSVCEASVGNLYTTEPGQSNYAWTVSAGAVVTSGGTATDNTIEITWLGTGPQSVSVNYENAANCAALAPTVYNVTVNTIPVPTISGLATVCDQDTETYSTEAGNSNYAWSVVGGIISSGGGVNDNTIAITWNTVGAQSVSVNYTNPGGCSAVLPTDYPVTVNSLPSPTITGPLSVCESTAGNIYLTEAGQSNYSWSVSAGGTITAGGGATDNSITITWTTAGPQAVTINYQNGAGCDALAATIQNVTVDALPLPTLAGPNNVCEASTGNTYTTEPGQSNYVWSVSVGGVVTLGGTGADNTIEITWSGTGPQSVSVNYENAANCTALAPTVYNVNVNTIPVPTITGPATVCDGSASNVYTTEVGATNYNWIVVGGVISSGGGVSDNTVTVTWNTVGAQSVSVNYQDANGCTAVAPSVFPVTVNALPVPTIAGTTLVCETNVEIYTTDAGETNYSWIISPPAAGTIISGGTGTDNFIEIQWVTSGAVSINYENAAGCTGLVPTVANVTVNPLPIPTLAGPNNVCEASTGNLYTTEVGQSNYVWTVSAGGTITSGGTGTDNTIEITWAAPGAQSVSVNYEDANTCSAATPTVVNVNVNALPVPTIAGPNVVCEGTTGATYTTEAGQANYLWVISAGGAITNGGTVADNFVEVTWTGTLPQTVSVNYDDVNSCTAATPTAYAVTVDVLPSSMTLAGPVDPICEDETADLDIQILGGTGPFELDLSTDGGGTVSETVPVPDNSLLSYETAALITNTTYTVFAVRDLGTGCVMDPANFAGPVIVMVNPKATILPISPIAACFSDGTFELSGVVGGSASNGTWSIVANGVPANLTATLPGAGANEFVATYTMDIGDVGAGNEITFRFTTDDPDGPGPGGCTAVSEDVVATVSAAAPTGTPVISGASDVCTSSILETFTSTSVTDATMYLWDVGTSGATIISGQGTTSIDVDFSTSTAGMYTFSVVGSNGCGNGPAGTFDVTVNQGPVIDTQPADLAACELTDATFTVGATGPALTYQWQESTDGVIFSPMAGEVSASLTLTAVTTVQDGNEYRVVVTGAGCPSVTSDPATLTVNIQVVIDTQPANQTVCMDDNVTFSVSATNATGYQWEESTDGINFTPIAGAILADLQLLNVPLTDNGNQYRVVVQSAGCTDVVSAFAILTVEDCTPPDCTSFTVQVDNATNASCGQSNGSFTLVPAGGVAPYIIEVDRNDGSGFVQSAADVTGLAPATYDYRVTDDQGCQFTGAVSIGEKQLAADFTEITDPDCNGDDGSVVITVTVGAGNYEYSVDNQATWTSFVSGEAVPIPPGTDYTILVQDNTGDFCTVASPLITVGEPSMISYTVGEIIESVPERASGSIQFLSITGGVPDYVMDAELVTPTAPDQYQPQMVDRTDIPVMQDATGTYAITLDDLYAGFYQIYIRDSADCEVEVLTPSDGEIEVPMDDNLFIPNVFTPNGDGVNDVFFIRNMPEDTPTSVVITNRYGKTVYENSNYANDWDANGLSDGVYYYSVGLQSERVKGWVEVWRGTR